MKLKIKKGDIVQVISGNEKGLTGRVLEIYPKRMQLLVEGVNIRSKHNRPSQQDQKGGIKQIERPIHYSNVNIIDADKNPTRIGIRYEDSGEGKKTPIRYSVSNGNDL